MTPLPEVEENLLVGALRSDNVPGLIACLDGAVANLNAVSWRGLGLRGGTKFGSLLMEAARLKAPNCVCEITRRLYDPQLWESTSEEECLGLNGALSLSLFELHQKILNGLPQIDAL